MSFLSTGCLAFLTLKLFQAASTPIKAMYIVVVMG